MERTIEWKRSLKIDNNFLIELNDIYQYLGLTPEFIIYTEDNTTYTYSGISSLLTHKFTEKISTFSVHSYNSTNRLDFKFSIEHNVLFNYDSVSICHYKIKDNDLDIILKDKAKNLYKQHTKSDWFLGKIGLFLILVILLILGYIYLLVDSIINGLSKTENLSISHFIFIWLCSSAFIWVIRYVDRKISSYFFNPIVYYFSYQKTKWDKIEKLRSNIFWCIFVAFAISIVGGIITSLILH